MTPIYYKFTHIFSHENHSGDLFRSGGTDLQNFGYLLFDMPLKIRCIQVNPPTEDKMHIQFVHDGLQPDNIVHRIQRAFTFKMMYMSLGTSVVATNSTMYITHLLDFT